MRLVPVARTNSTELRPKWLLLGSRDVRGSTFNQINTLGSNVLSTMPRQSTDTEEASQVSTRYIGQCLMCTLPTLVAPHCSGFGQHKLQSSARLTKRATLLFSGAIFGHYSWFPSRDIAIGPRRRLIPFVAKRQLCVLPLSFIQPFTDSTRLRLCLKRGISSYIGEVRGNTHGCRFSTGELVACKDPVVECFL